MVRTLSMALFFFLSAKPRTTVRTQRLICFSLFPTLCYRIPMDGSYTPKHFSPLFSRLVHRVLVSFSFLCFERERQRKGWPAKTRVCRRDGALQPNKYHNLYTAEQKKNLYPISPIPEKKLFVFQRLNAIHVIIDLRIMQNSGYAYTSGSKWREGLKFLTCLGLAVWGVR